MSHAASSFVDLWKLISKEDEEKVAIENIAAATNSFSPLLTTIGGGGLVGFLIGFMIKKLFKILAIIAGAFFAALIYLEQQGIVNVNWVKLQGVLSTIVSTVNSTASGGVGGNHTVAASLLPTLMNLGVPLTGSMVTGFTIGFIKG
jgi:uncharacterized membrane protein (Fun14 family)